MANRNSEKFERPMLTDRRVRAIASGRLTLRKLFMQKGWPWV